MELLQLRYFIALAQNGNLTQTACDLFISPPALSASISRLEKELGIQLFDRSKGRIQLNNYGKTFLESALKTVDELQSGVDTVRMLGVANDTQVSIAAGNQMLWNKMIGAFMAEYPDIRIVHRYFHNSFKSHENALLTQYDFFMSRSGALLNDNVTSLHLFDGFNLFVSVHKDHPLASRESINISELKDEVFLFPPKDAYLNPLYYRICREAGFEPTVLAECSQGLLTYLYVQKKGILFTTISENPYDIYTPSKLLRLDIPIYRYENFKRAIYWDKRRKLGKAALLFRDFAVEYSKTHLQWKKPEE